MISILASCNTVIVVCTGETTSSQGKLLFPQNGPPKAACVEAQVQAGAQAGQGFTLVLLVVEGA